MEIVVQALSFLLGVPLEILTINAIRRIGIRRYFFPFALLVSLFVTTLVEMPASVVYYYYLGTGTTPGSIEHTRWVWAGRTLATSYWRDEAVRQLLWFATVISLIYAASARLASHRAVRTIVIVAAAAFTLGSLLAHYRPVAPGKYGLWMSPWTRDLEFCSAILDMALWLLLIGSRKRDQRLLMLSGGLGVLFAGEAVGESVRNLGVGNRIAVDGGGIIILAVNLLFLYIWWQAFRSAEGPARELAGARPGAS